MRLSIGSLGIRNLIKWYYPGKKNQATQTILIFYTKRWRTGDRRLIDGFAADKKQDIPPKNHTFVIF